MNDKQEPPILIMLFGIWMLAGLVPLIKGLIESRNEHFTSCHKSWAKIEYIFPHYRIGCYLGSPLKADQKQND